MDAYTEFAKVYDLFMDNIPYEEWGAYLKGLLHENGVDDGLVLELGCGTGTMTEILAEAGYDMIGVDQSEEMLSVVRDKADQLEMGDRLLLLQQDGGRIGLLQRYVLQVHTLDLENRGCLFGHGLGLSFAWMQSVHS